MIEVKKQRKSDNTDKKINKLIQILETHKISNAFHNRAKIHPKTNKDQSQK